ncbi:hypothetical protein VHEMI03922 [[Torrubiella] hemipterigena]|uniref:Uncharacterized protein n=1 Tax=[Torrubiella] hemipterigena TaxID=1531966 RepID=A0A0A1TCN6_9HYPO|nr:hypothetical protein VHEMI03922 [[Torrubiella] hemipterigena]
MRWHRVANYKSRFPDPPPIRTALYAPFKGGRSTMRPLTNPHGETSTVAVVPSFMVYERVSTSILISNSKSLSMTLFWPSQVDTFVFSWKRSIVLA